MDKKENLYCSIQRNRRRELENGKLDATCYTPEELRVIAKKINLKITDGMKKMELWKLIDDAMIQCKGREWCWAKKLGMDSYLKTIFVPEGPNTGNAWLSNENIDNVLEQYSLAFPEYEYAGCFSVQVSQAAQKYGFLDPLEPRKLVSIMKKRRYIGGVFNLDCYECPGTHWTNFMIVNTAGVPEFRYYDSVGNNNTDNKIPVQVVDLVTSIGSLLRAGGNSKKSVSGTKKLFEIPCDARLMVVGKNTPDNKQKRGKGRRSGKIPGAKWTGGEITKGVNSGMIGGIKFMFNGKEHQRGDTECGVYSIHVQDLQINGMKFEQICQLHLPDNKISTFRDIYFRPE